MKKINIKKLLTALMCTILALLLVFGLTACGSSDDEDDDKKSSSHKSAIENVFDQTYHGKSDDEDDDKKSSSYKSAIENAIDHSYYGKSDKIKDLAPQAYWDYLEEETDFDFDEYVEDFEDSWVSRKESLEEQHGEDYTLDYEVKDKQKIDDDELDELKQKMNSRYNIDEDDVKMGYKIDAEFTIKGSKSERSWEAEDMYIIKIGSGWYPISASGYFTVGG